MKQYSITLIISYVLILCSLFQISIGKVIYKREPQEPLPPTEIQTTADNTTPEASVSPTPSYQPVQVKILSPIAISGPLLFKIGKKYPFNWTYTAEFDPELVPKSLNIYTKAFRGPWNFTVGENLSPQTTSIIWDTSLITNPPPPAGTYIFSIWDERGPSPTNATSGGQLEPFSGLYFQLYSPKPKINLADYTCAVCDGNSPLARAQDNKPYLPIAVLGGILVLTMLFVIFVKV